MGSRFVRAAALGACLLWAGLLHAEPLALSVATAATGVVGDQGVVRMTLSPQSRDDFARFTTANAGRQVELRIDGKSVLSARLIDPILAGQVEIGGLDLDATFDTLAERLKSGDARIEVETVE